MKQDAEFDSVQESLPSGILFIYLLFEHYFSFEEGSKLFRSALLRFEACCCSFGEER